MADAKPVAAIVVAGKDSTLMPFLASHEYGMKPLLIYAIIQAYTSTYHYILLSTLSLT